MDETEAQTAGPVGLFYDAFKASPIGIALENLEGQPLFVNQALCSMLGFSEEELRSKHCVDFSPPEDAAKDWALFEQLRMGLIDHYHLDKRFCRRDGSLIWGRLSISLLNDRASPMVVAMVEDITGRKRAEQELSQSSERLRLTMEAGGVGGWEWEIKSGKNLWFGQKHAQLGGKSEVSAEGFWDRVHPEDRSWLQKAVEKAMQNHEELRVEFRVTWPDGTVRWLQSQARFFYDSDGAPERMLGASVDITARKRAEETLRESEEKFRSVFQGAGVGMVIVSPEGRFLSTNSTFCNYLGYTEEELQAKTVQSITSPEDWPAFSKRLGEALQERRGFQRFEKRCLHKSGRIVYTESSASLILNRDGVPQYFVGEVLDVTKRKEAEQVLSGISRKLIEAQEQERQRIARELHDDIGQRLALVAVGFDQIRQHAPALPPDILRRMRELQTQTMELSTDVQTMSHALHAPKLELLGLVAAMKSLCHEFAEHHRMEIDFRGQELPGPLSSDTSLCLSRVLQEALQNAAKHSGVKHVDVQLRGTTEEIQLIVSDLGKGFDLNVALKGRGLGLTSMQERVRVLNGTIMIRSKPMGGTTIHVRLPVRSEPAVQRAAG
ncbi:MAG TPA: PAS domain S-box protein [Terriglobales bacterium]|nr:PAS domain S-box protein [Terriglobales bacterium]